MPTLRSSLIAMLVMGAIGCSVDNNLVGTNPTPSDAAAEAAPTPNANASGGAGGGAVGGAVGSGGVAGEASGGTTAIAGTTATAGSAQPDGAVSDSAAKPDAAIDRGLGGASGAAGDGTSGGSGGASMGSGGATSGSGGAANRDAAVTNSGGTLSGGFTNSSGGQSGSAGTTVGSSLPSCDGGVLSLQAVWPLPTTISAWPWAIAVDGQGNVYVAGSFDVSASFGTVVLTSNGPQDMFLAKFDSTGALVYANRYGGPSFDDASPALAVDDVGNAYFGGGFGQTLDFGGGTTPLVALTSDAFVAKIGPTGQTLWAQRFGWAGETWANGGSGYVYSIAIAPGGDPVIAGAAGATITLGSTNWTSAGTNSQPFVARLKSADGSVVWGAASGGTFDTGQMFVSVDSQGRTFVAGQALSGGGAWGTGVGTYRVGFDASGKPMWSRFDQPSLPMGMTVDAAGRLVVVEDTLDPTAPVTIGTTTFSAVNSALVLLFSPIDGTLISGAQISETAPWGVVADTRGNSLVTGTYWDPPAWGSASLPRSGDQPLFLAAVDGTSKPAGLAGLGTTTGAQPTGIAMDRSGSGRIFVAASLNAATTSTVGPIAAGPFIGVFGPDPCVTGGGPQGSMTGNASDHGDLPPDGSPPVTQPDAGTPGPCPASSALAVNGAACPVQRGCAYGSECCICIPTPCGGRSTTWTCTTLAAPDPGCPSSPPANGVACSTSGLQCTYCASGGRQLATCTAAGWQSGYAQLLCN